MPRNVKKEKSFLDGTSIRNLGSLGNIPVLGQPKLSCGCNPGSASAYKKTLAREVITILECKQCGCVLDFNMVKKWRLFTFPNGIQIEINRLTFFPAIKEYFIQLKTIWKDTGKSVERIQNEMSKVSKRHGKSQ